MNKVIVAPADHGKFQVLVNYIRQGIDYNSKAHAELEAKNLRERMGIKPAVIKA